MSRYSVYILSSYSYCSYQCYIDATKNIQICAQVANNAAIVMINYHFNKAVLKVEQSDDIAPQPIVDEMDEMKEN